MNGNNTGPKVAIGCGSVLLFLAFCVSAFGAFHVFVDPHGAISADEAAPALIGGVLCMGVDFLIVVVGIVLVMRGAGQGVPPAGLPPQGMGGPGTSNPGTSNPGMPQGGTQVMDGNSLPGAPPMGANPYAPGGMNPGMGAAPQQGTPWHLLTGCGTLFFTASLCLSLGGIGYFYQEVQHWQENLYEDQSHAYDPYGGSYGSDGVDDLLVMLDQGQIEENQQYMGFSSCCCFGSFLLACAFAGGTFRLMQRRRQGS